MEQSTENVPPGMTSAQSETNGLHADMPLSIPVLLNGIANTDAQIAMMADPSMAQALGMSADEIALYDRQIRLWGVKAQEKLRSARILLIGMKALANEIAKNLVLAGIGTMTILDPESITEDDLGSQFFISEGHVGQNRAQAALPQVQKLNPRVFLFADTEPILAKDPTYFLNFDICIATGLDITTLGTVNTFARLNGCKFYAAHTHGMYGYVFADLIIHDYAIEREMSNKATEIKAETPTRKVIGTSIKKENNKIIEIVSKQETYCPIMLANSSGLASEITSNRRRRMKVEPLLPCLRALFDFQKATGRLPAHNAADLRMFTSLANEKHKELLLPIETLRADFLRMFLQNLGSEIAPVCAFLGGALAQDVINVLGQREQPLQNMLLFDGETFEAPVYALHPPPDLMAMSTYARAAAMPVHGIVNGDLNGSNGMVSNGVQA